MEKVSQLEIEKCGIVKVATDHAKKEITLQLTATEEPADNAAEVSAYILDRQTNGYQVYVEDTYIEGSREAVMQRALGAVGDTYDLALIDCSPSLGILTINSLVAADRVIVPTQPQEADLRGLRLFLDTIDQVRQELNPGIDYRVLVTFFDTRLNHHAAAIETMREAGLPLFDTRIGRTVRIPEAINNRQSMIEYEPDNKRSKEFLQLADEVKSWLKIKR